MRYHTYTPNQARYPIAVLVPQIQAKEIERSYLDPVAIDLKEVIVFDLHQEQGKKKTPVGIMKTYIEEELQPTLDEMGVEYLVVADAEYFKVLTKSVKTEVHLGYVLDSVFGNQKIVYVPNHRTIFYDPEKVRAKIAQGMSALVEHRLGNYADPGVDIIKFAAYPETDAEIEEWLVRLLEMDMPLAIDIEAFSLKHHSAGIGTISFAWSKHEGITFPVDYVPIPEATEAPYGKQVRNEHRRKMLRAFFEQLQSKAIYHNIAYDAYVLIYQLFMDDLLDQEGMLRGLEIMLRNWDDTKLITYLATNSCAGNVLGLKPNAQEFSGNWAQDDIEDITGVPLDRLLQYNLIDALSTHYVREKHWGRMIQDEQLDIYENLFKPCMWDIIQMQLTGMPVIMDRAREVDTILQADLKKAFDTIMSSEIVEEFTYTIRESYIEKRNEKLKKKRISMDDEEVQQVFFNPNSDIQMRQLLFDHLGLPVISLTASKLPSTDGETIEALLNRTEDPKVKALLEAFQLHSIISTLTNNFMPAILGAVQGKDGWHYLFGNFNLGGTVSGRLSSSKPNLQNLPSTGKGHKIKGYYAKLIKSCFGAPPGWLLVGCDFISLEDRISALTTKDPQKLKVYIDGYDGHSLRAYAYFGDQMPAIRLAEEKRVFKVTQGDVVTHLLEGDLVTLPDGTVTTIEKVL